MLFPEAPASCDKEILKKILLHCTSIRISSKPVSQTFKILFQTGDINLYVLRGVFLADLPNYKTPFLTKKTSTVKSEIHFSREAIKVYRGKVLKKNSIIGRSCSSANLFIIHDYIKNAKEDVPLRVENV